MRVAVAVTKMLDTANNIHATPEEFASIIGLTMTKVASMNPNGQAALKIVQARFLKDAMQAPLNVRRNNYVTAGNQKSR